MILQWDREISQRQPGNSLWGLDPGTHGWLPGQTVTGGKGNRMEAGAKAHTWLFMPFQSSVRPFKASCGFSFNSIYPNIPVKSQLFILAIVISRNL